MIESNELVRWIINVSPLLTFQLALLLILRIPVRKYFGAASVYSLWLLLPAWNIGLWIVLRWNGSMGMELPIVTYNLPAISSVLDGSFVPVLDESVTIATSTRAVTVKTDTWVWLFVAWLTGFICMSVHHLLRMLVAHRNIKNSSAEPVSKYLHDQVEQAGFSKTIRIVVVDGLHSPALYGLMSSALLIPADFKLRFSLEQRQTILLHEYVHLQRNDNAINLLALFLQTLFWFNPILYFGYRAMRMDQEISCDHRALQSASPSQRRAYAEALLDVASHPKGFEHVPIVSHWGSVRMLKIRTQMLVSFRNQVLNVNSRRALVVTSFVVGAFLSFSITPVSTSLASAENDSIPMLEAEIIPEHFIEIAEEATRRHEMTIDEPSLGIPADSEYLAFVIDTSGSMTNNQSWNLLLDEIVEVMNSYPRLQGFQIMNDMGDYLYNSTRDRWIPYTDSNVQEMLRDLNEWNPVSNSSPLEGIARVINSLGGTERNISVYVMGDDLQQEAVLLEVLLSVREINDRDSEQSRLVRIHSIMFPTLFSAPLRFQDTAYNYLALMRSLTRQNGGTFELLADPQPR